MPEKRLSGGSFWSRVSQTPHAQHFPTLMGATPPPIAARFRRSDASALIFTAVHGHEQPLRRFKLQTLVVIFHQSICGEHDDGPRSVLGPVCNVHVRLSHPFKNQCPCEHHCTDNLCPCSFSVASRVGLTLGHVIIVLLSTCLSGSDAGDDTYTSRVYTYTKYTGINRAKEATPGFFVVEQYLDISTCKPAVRLFRNRFGLLLGDPCSVARYKVFNIEPFREPWRCLRPAFCRPSESYHSLHALIFSACFASITCYFILYLLS